MEEEMATWMIAENEEGTLNLFTRKDLQDILEEKVGVPMVGMKFAVDKNSKLDERHWIVRRVFRDGLEIADFLDLLKTMDEKSGATTTDVLYTLVNEVARMCRK